MREICGLREKERKEGGGKMEEKKWRGKKERKRSREAGEKEKNESRKGGVGRQGANGISHRAVLTGFPQDGLTDVLLG